jgi:hypothetical protein
VCGVVVWERGSVWREMFTSKTLMFQVSWILLLCNLLCISGMKYLLGVYFIQVLMVISESTFGV